MVDDSVSCIQKTLMLRMISDGQSWDFGDFRGGKYFQNGRGQLNRASLCEWTIPDSMPDQAAWSHPAPWRGISICCAPIPTRHQIGFRRRYRHVGHVRHQQIFAQEPITAERRKSEKRLGGRRRAVDYQEANAEAAEGCPKFGV